MTPALYAFSFVSGVAALAYEVVWAKLLALSFGGTTLATSAVLAGFLGGMGLGAALCHRWVRPFRSALRLYAALELGIAVVAVALTLLLPALPPAFAALGGALPSGPGVILLRFVLAFALLAPPAALMGATFPALGMALIRSRSGLERHLGALYGLNTAGAALGALLAGLVLVEALGLRGTALLAGSANLAVGLAALALERRRHRTGSPRGAGVAAAPGAAPAAEAPAAGPGGAPPPDATGPGAETPLPAALTGSVLALSGFATLAYEVLWLRALGYLFGSSTYALSVLLACFLAGLALGALGLRPVSRRARLEPALGVCLLAVAALSVAAMGALALLVGSDELAGELSIFSQGFFGRAWWVRLLLEAGVAAALLLPATLCMGLVFPLASSLFLADLRRLGRRLGTAVLLSNAGSIAGALLAALAILPALGTVGGTHLVGGLSLLLGGLVLARAGARGPVALAAGALALLAVAAVLVLPDRIAFSGAGRGGRDAALVFEEEGDLATVQVWRASEAPELGMAIDGTTIGATPGWDAVVFSKQVLLAALPFALETRLRTALTVGLGSGSTLATLAAEPALERIDAVEINAAVVRAARLFPYAAALEDDRVHLHVEDALQHLLRSPRRYDLIVSDGKQARTSAGTARLLSSEFYALARERLAPHGLFVQWISLAVDTREFRVVVRTLRRVFPYVDLFFEPPAHLVFVASREPLSPRPQPSEAAFARSAAGAALARLRIPDAAAARARWAAGGDALGAIAGPGAVNTWDRLPLEFLAYRETPADWQRGAEEILALLLEVGPEASPVGRALAPPGADATRAARLLRRAHERALAGDLPAAIALARRSADTDPSDPAARYWLRTFLLRQRARGG